MARGGAAAHSAAMSVSVSNGEGHPKFNGVKVFSATMFADREHLGEKVGAWIAANPSRKPVEMVVTQSSDDSFHCLAITLFYWEG